MTAIVPTPDDDLSTTLRNDAAEWEALGSPLRAANAREAADEIERLRRMTGHRTVEIAADDLAYWRGDNGRSTDV